MSTDHIPEDLSKSLDGASREALDKMQETLGDAGEKAKAAYADLRSKVQDGYETARTRVQDGYDTARVSVQDGYETARDKVHEGLDVAREKSADALDVGVRYVRANPIPVIAGALVVGALLGYLYMRRSEEELSFRERYDVDDKLDGARGWLKDRLTPVAEAAQRRVRSAGDAFDDARQYIDPLVERTKKAGNRFQFWQ